MMLAEEEERLVSPSISEAWRPLRAFGALALLCSCAALLAAANRSPAASETLFMLAGLMVLLGIARSVVWCVLRGRVIVTYTKQGIRVKRGGAVLETYPWASIERVDVIPGHRWPEWSRWADFAKMWVTRAEGEGARIDASPQFLLVHPARVSTAQQRVDAVVRRYIGRAG